MPTRPFLLALLTLLLSTPASAAEISPYVEDVRTGAVFEFTIHSSLPDYVFRLIANPEQNIIERIEVSRRGDATVIQTLAPRMEPPFRGAAYIQSEDINFDGYVDLKVLTAWGATGNTFYDYYLFQPATGRFAFDESFGELCNPVPHPETRQITTHGVAGMAGHIYANATYRVIDGRPVMVREERQDWLKEDHLFLKVVKELQQGRMTVMSEERIRDDAWQ